MSYNVAYGAPGAEGSMVWLPLPTKGVVAVTAMPPLPNNGGFTVGARVSTEGGGPPVGSVVPGVGGEPFGTVELVLILILVVVRVEKPEMVKLILCAG